MQISILQCMAITFVVVGHIGGASVLGEWFPIYSFHMPLWFFISGYLYNEKVELNYRSFVWKKIKRLVIPYFVLNTCYGLIAAFLTLRHIIDYGVELNLYSLLIKPWQEGNQFGIDLAGWFVLCLFLIQIIYVLLRKIVFKTSFMNEYNFFVLLLVCGIAGVTAACHGYRSGWWLTVIRVLYALPFYHAGRMYHIQWEKKPALSNGKYFLLVFLISYGAQVISHNHLFIGVWNADFNKLGEYPFVAYITPIAGIMFWIRIANLIGQHFENNKFIYFMSRNTWTVMMHHQFVLLIINYCLLKVHQCNIGILETFDVTGFRENPWYTYQFFDNSNSLIIFSVLGIVIPLAVKYILLKFAKRNCAARIISRIY
ncbi:MAG: acyltransferase [Muricomes sp.]|uniref:acyltransferase family protein n=1 Tax=Faecalicatena contorta TaxID=39482 RepID=UPI002EB66DCB|nr:acyltransferase [Muricomes sp.]